MLDRRLNRGRKDKVNVVVFDNMVCNEMRIGFEIFLCDWLEFYVSDIVLSNLFSVFNLLGDMVVIVILDLGLW